MLQFIITEISNGIGVIKINRPEVRNALHAETLKELEEAIDQFEKNDEVKVIVITGEGDKSFAAGADIKQLREREMLEALVPGMQGTYKKVENCSKATIAAINGFALGGGCELALSCDIRIAADHAKIGLPELNLAIIPGAGGTQRLSRIIGKGKALEMILTGKILSGKEAEQFGLVSRSVAYEQLWGVVKETAEKIMNKGPVAVKLAKMVIHRGMDVDIDTALMLEKLAQTIVFGTEDKNEGTQAFIEKRSPNYKNK
ncbi:enoyl-CoA hydratase-related protein [Microaerobacter geothermalis]|uniref:enoyl-CoA hydratase/isomerase family protein n=1 Tax=Microaerobacter geothermalis TaxID=674972 RepID=UPI001F39E6D3|nr:enoyl-CoA hydratase-related protein [Microaerobacter geothermalis]MCF6094854.1 enoyl-CoA hydratase-related protein [Microaerobacter geothermalis]